jgi:hypothetical protein
LHHFRGVDTARLLQDKKQLEDEIQGLTGFRLVQPGLSCIRLVQQRSGTGHGLSAVGFMAADDRDVVRPLPGSR